MTAPCDFHTPHGPLWSTNNYNPNSYGWYGDFRSSITVARAELALRAHIGILVLGLATTSWFYRDTTLSLLVSKCIEVKKVVLT